MKRTLLLQISLLWIPSCLGLLVCLAARREAPRIARDYPGMRSVWQLVQTKRYSEASHSLEQITRNEPHNALAWYLYGVCLHVSGEIDRALPVHLKAQEFASNAAPSAYNIACVYALRDEKERAFAWLERATEEGFHDPHHLRTDSDMDNLRDDPRFQRFLASGQRSPAGY